MDYTRYPGSRLKSGEPAAHRMHRLMLLGSPPDMIHGFPLRRTESSTLLTGGRRHKHFLMREFIPAIADCRLQGTADSPTSAALSKATVLYYYNKAIMANIFFFTNLKIVL